MKLPGANQCTRGSRLSALRPLPARQIRHASAHRQQHGGHAGDCLGLPGKEQARQDAQPSDTASRLKHACRPSFDHATRSGRLRHVRNSKIADISPIRNTKIFGQSFEFANQNIFMPQPTPGNSTISSSIPFNGKLWCKVWLLAFENHSDTLGLLSEFSI